MINDYLDKKLHTATYKTLADKTYFGEIPSVRGVWANAKNLKTCREQLRDVLEDWLVLKIRDRKSIPGFRIRTPRRSLKLSHA